MTNARWQNQRRVRAAATVNGPAVGGTSFGSANIGNSLPTATLIHRNDSANEIHSVFFAMFHAGSGTETLSVNFGPEASPYTWADAQPINTSLGDRSFFLMPGDILSVHSLAAPASWRFNVSVQKFKMA